EELKMNINNTFSGSNCLTYACSGNKNVDVIRYLIEDCKMDAKQPDVLGFTYLMYASDNLVLIVYLVETCEIDVTCINTYGNNCLTSLCHHNTNCLGIATYLIEET